MNLELNPDEKLKQWSASNGDADTDELLVKMSGGLGAHGNEY
jgi:hypothetical protein